MLLLGPRQTGKFSRQMELSSSSQLPWVSYPLASTVFRRLQLQAPQRSQLGTKRLTRSTTGGITSTDPRSTRKNGGTSTSRQTVLLKTLLLKLRGPCTMMLTLKLSRLPVSLSACCQDLGWQGRGVQAKQRVGVYWTGWGQSEAELMQVSMNLLSGQMAVADGPSD